MCSLNGLFFHLSSCLWWFHQHKVSVNQEIKNCDEFLLLRCSELTTFHFFQPGAWIFPHKNTCEGFMSSDSAVYFELGPCQIIWCRHIGAFKVNRGSYCSSAGWFLHPNILAPKIEEFLQIDARRTYGAFDCLWKQIQTVTFQKSPKPGLHWPGGGVSGWFCIYFQE